VRLRESAAPGQEVTDEVDDSNLHAGFLRKEEAEIWRPEERKWGSNVES
jgi:hypothetical protein